MRVGIDILFSSDFPIGSVSVSCSFGSSSAEEVTDLKRWIAKQVKYRGVDVGAVKSTIIDPDNSRLVRVEVRLRKETPGKTDTRASLTLKGITGVIFIELNGGDPAAKTLLADTPKTRFPRFLRKKPASKPCSTSCRRWSRNSAPWRTRSKKS